MGIMIVRQVHICVSFAIVRILDNNLIISRVSLPREKEDRRYEMSSVDQ
jgi:hypothetical protein